MAKPQFPSHPMRIRHTLPTKKGPQQPHPPGPDKRDPKPRAIPQNHPCLTALTAKRSRISKAHPNHQATQNPHQPSAHPPPNPKIDHKKLPNQGKPLQNKPQSSRA